MSQPMRNAPAVPNQRVITELPSTKPRDAAIAMDAVLGHGDLSMLTAEERAFHYVAVCESIGLNPKTQPFEYVSFQGRLVLYPRKNATDQLSAMHGITFSEPIQEVKKLGNAEMLVTKMQGWMPDGRSTWDMSTIFLGGMQGQELANQFMKGVTKARRRVTLALVGLGGDVPVSDEDRPMPSRIRESHQSPSLTPQEITAYASVSDSEGPGEAIEANPPQHTDPPPPDAVPASDTARRAFFAVCNERGISDEDQKALVKAYYGHDSRKDLTEEEARVIGGILRSAPEQKIKEMIFNAHQQLIEGEDDHESEEHVDDEPITVEASADGATNMQEQEYARLIADLDACTTKRETAVVAKNYNTAQAAGLVPSDRASLFFSALNEKNRDIEQAKAAPAASE